MSPHTAAQSLEARPQPAAVSFWTLVALTALGPFSLQILMPSLPALARDLAVPYSQAQLALTLYLVGFAISQLIYGPLSDRFGRRPVMLLGISLFLVGTALSAFAPGIGWLLVGRSIQALGGGAGMVLARAIIRDLYARENAAGKLATVTMVMVVAPMTAPALGGLIDEHLGWRVGFALVLAVALVVLWATLTTLKETRDASLSLGTWVQQLRATLALARRREFWRYAGQVGWTAATFFSFLGSAPYLMVTLWHQPPSHYGFYFIGLACCYIAGNFTTGRLVARLGVERLIALGTALAVLGSMIVGGVYFAGWLAPQTLFPAMALVAYGNGLCIATGLTGAISVEPRLAGAASGLAGATQMGLAALVSYLVGRSMDDNALPMVVGIFACAIMAFAADRLLRR